MAMPQSPSSPGEPLPEALAIRNDDCTVRHSKNSSFRSLCAERPCRRFSACFRTAYSDVSGSRPASNLRRREFPAFSRFILLGNIPGAAPWGVGSAGTFGSESITCEPAVTRQAIWHVLSRRLPARGHSKRMVRPISLARVTGFSPLQQSTINHIAAIPGAAR